MEWCRGQGLDLRFMEISPFISSFSFKTIRATNRSETNQKNVSYEISRVSKTNINKQRITNLNHLAVFLI
jgi:hypothetical protein